MDTEWNEYIYSGRKKLRMGFTTGTCATAATKASLMMIFEKKNIDAIEIKVPAGKVIPIKINDCKFSEGKASCSVIKDGGDDADITNGLKICAEVKLTEEEVKIIGGKGVGRVTRKGLKIPVGEAAINKVPREMILNVTEELFNKYGYTGGADITITVPDGEKAAEKTFNSNLGIMGGISILGTSGMVEPMSEKALLDSINSEMDILKAEGNDYIIFTPGNYGENFIEKSDFPLKKTVKISNFVGDAIDHAMCIDIKGILLIGHIGKFVKLAGGVMNTHSKYADCRFEIMNSCLARCGGSRELLEKIDNCSTTDEALEYICKENLQEELFKLLSEKTEKYLNRRIRGTEIEIAALVYSEEYGLLYKTSKADELIRKIKEN